MVRARLGSLYWHQACAKGLQVHCKPCITGGDWPASTYKLLYKHHKVSRSFN